MGYFVVVFKKTTIKDDDTRRKHMLTENEKKQDDPKYKSRDYVVIGDPATELKKITLTSSIRTSPAFCCC